MHAMLARFLQNKEAVNLFCLTLRPPKDRQKTAIKFADEDWALMAAVAGILQPFREIVEMLQRRSTTIAVVLPTMRIIEHVLTKADDPGQVRESVVHQNYRLLLVTATDHEVSYP